MSIAGDRIDAAHDLADDIVGSDARDTVTDPSIGGAEEARRDGERERAAERESATDEEEAPAGDPRDREIAKLRRINAALMERVERSLDQQGNAFSLFQTAIGLEAQVRRRTSELTHTLADLECSNLELKTARDTAEHANRSKTRFLAAASHDVLQPLNAALLSMSSLAAEQASAEGRRLCHQVERSLETMDTLLRTLVYMSRLDSGDVVPDIGSVSLDALFASIASDFEPVAKLAGLELRVRRSGLSVRSDGTMLRRILQNIVANALRYTRTGGVLLIAGARGDRVHVRIADTGIGIARESYRDVFVEFRRCAPGVGRDPVGRDPVGRVADERLHDDHDDEAGAGLGLGLAIVERMVRALDHEVRLNSRVGRGSCFGLTMTRCDVPARARRVSPAPAADCRGLSGARLLVIENDLVALQAMDALLVQWGCELRLASSTAEALSAVTEGGFAPDLLVADQHLDGEDRGSRAIELLRSRLRADLPALLVSANPSERLRRHADANRIELMEKPLKPAQLRALLTHLRQRGTSSGSVRAPGDRTER